MSDFLSLFTVPEKTKAGYSFADTPVKISFNESRIAVYGVPLEATTSFGKGTARGPEAIRMASARQIETFVMDEKADIYKLAPIFDLGDIRLPGHKSGKKQTKKGVEKTLSFLDTAISTTVEALRAAGKIPVLLGGEHTLTYYQLKPLAREEPIVIHFDAHRDMKPEYEGLKMCHTTPFYHLLQRYIPGENMVQIGIRQADSDENETAARNGVVTFDAWQVHDDISAVTGYLGRATAGRKVYISFDIDAYDLPYVPCTGTPEPFGLDPFQVLRIVRSIHPTAQLVGMDMVEVGLKNGDYREGALATQTLYRILARGYARNY